MTWDNDCLCYFSFLSDADFINKTRSGVAIDLGQCNPDTCQHFGKCLVDDNGYHHCQCSSIYTGKVTQLYCNWESRSMSKNSWPRFRIFFSALYDPDTQMRGSFVRWYDSKFRNFSDVPSDPSGFIMKFPGRGNLHVAAFRAAEDDLQRRPKNAKSVSREEAHLLKTQLFLCNCGTECRMVKIKKKEQRWEDKFWRALQLSETEKVMF